LPAWKVIAGVKNVGVDDFSTNLTVAAAAAVLTALVDDVAVGGVSTALVLNRRVAPLKNITQVIPENVNLVLNRRVTELVDDVAVGDNSTILLLNRRVTQTPVAGIVVDDNLTNLDFEAAAAVLTALVGNVSVVGFDALVETDEGEIMATIAPRLLNRARMSTATTGTGAVTLGSSVVGYFSFAQAGAVTGDPYTYVIEDGDDFEVGRRYTASGTTSQRYCDWL
jgi:hypothetical protein